MNRILRAAVAGAAFLAVASATAAPAYAAPAYAAPADEPSLIGALVARDADGVPVEPGVRPGESVPVTLGVVNKGPQDLDGVVVNVRAYNELRLPKTFTNCRYARWGNMDSAWCEFDRTLPVGETYVLAKFEVGATVNFKKDDTVLFQYFPKAYIDERGGIDQWAREDAEKGTVPVAGTGSELELVAEKLTVPQPGSRLASVKVKVAGAQPTPTATTPTGPAPTSPAPSSPAPSTSVSPAATAGGTGGGGGLPVTGTDTITVIGVGAALLIAGALAVVFTRRRRFDA